MAKLTKKATKQISKHLAGLSKDQLVELVMDQVTTDAELRDRLVMAAAEGGSLDVASFRRSFTDALRSRSSGRRDYPRTSGPWAREVHGAIERIAALLPAGHAAEVVEIAEYALGRVDKAMGQIDDSSGWFSEIVSSLERLHHDACVVATPDSVKLARRLFAFEIDGDWDIFIDSVEKYADVLGDDGIAEIRRLAEERWAELPPPPKPGEYERTAGAFHLTRMMAKLAEQAGDIDAQVAVMSRDLSSPYQYLEIAEMLAERGRDDEALAWAERGLEAKAQMPPHLRHDYRVDDFVVERYLGAGRIDDLLEVVRSRFGESADVGSFGRLRQWAQRAERWGDERVAAFSLLRERSVQRAAEAVSASGRAQARWRAAPTSPPYEDLIAALLLDGATDEAWTEASEHGCTQHLWLQLAAAVEGDRPLDAARVYEREIENLIDRKQTHTYESAAERIGHIRDLYLAASDLAGFDGYLEELRRRHKTKVKFQKILAGAEVGWSN